MWNLIKWRRSEKTIIPFNCFSSAENHGLPWSESPSPVVRSCSALAWPWLSVPAVKQEFPPVHKKPFDLRKLAPSQVDEKCWWIPASRWGQNRAPPQGEDKARGCWMVQLMPGLSTIQAQRLITEEAKPGCRPLLLSPSPSLASNERYSGVGVLSNCSTSLTKPMYPV